MAQQAPASGLTAGERLDRLPFGKFHRKILMLIGAGMFFDAMELYLAGSVLGALVKSGYSTVELNAQFVSWTFFGLVVGSWMAGVLGDRGDGGARIGREDCTRSLEDHPVVRRGLRAAATEPGRRGIGHARNSSWNKSFRSDTIWNRTVRSVTRGGGSSWSGRSSW